MTDKPRIRGTADGLSNIVANLGTSRDKRSHNTFGYGYDAANWPELEAAYTNNWIAKQIVNVPVDDGIREWRAWQCEEAAEIEAEEHRLDLKGSYKEGRYWARLYGGSIILMVTDQPLDQPLDVSKVKKGGLKRLVVLDRWDVSPQNFNYFSPIDANYLMPENYTVTGGATMIHWTHVIRCDGELLPRRMRALNNGWGDSTLRRVMEDVKDAVATKGGIASLVLEANVDVIQRKGLSNELASDQDTQILKRYGLAAQMKSIVNTLLLDGDETYERKSLAFSGLSQIMEQFMVWLSGAADIPMTRLFGRSAAGLSATGEGDLNNYYDSVRAEQEGVFRMELRRLDDVLMMSALGRIPDECSYEWRPLYQESGTELAQQDLARAQAEDLRLQQGVLKPSQIALRMKDDGSYAITDEDIERMQADEDAQLNGEFDPDGNSDPFGATDPAESGNAREEEEGGAPGSTE